MRALSVIAMLLWTGASWACNSGLEVTASGYEPGHRPSQAVDGDPFTYWMCRGGGDECWLEIDTGEAVQDDNLIIKWDSTYDAPLDAEFDLALSVDGITWKTVFSGTKIDNSWSPVFMFPTQWFRYARVYGHGMSGTNENRLQEIDFELGDPGSEIEFNQRSIIGVQASSYLADNTPFGAIDFDPSTHWTASNGEWIRFELAGGRHPVDNVRIAWLNPHLQRASFDIEVSENGSTWEPFYSGVSAECLKPVAECQLRLENNYNSFMWGMCAQYVRIIGRGNDGPRVESRSKNSITKVEVWGPDTSRRSVCD